MKKTKFNEKLFGLTEREVKQVKEAVEVFGADQIFDRLLNWYEYMKPYAPWEAERYYMQARYLLEFLV